MDLVNDHELSRLGSKKGVGILKTPPVDRTLKVEVYRSRLSLRGDLLRQGGLTHLPGSEQNNSRHLPEAFFDGWTETTRNHLTPVF